MLLLFGILIVCITIVFIVWAIAKMVAKDCPHCVAEGASGTIVPVIPLKLWACINCGQTSSTGQLVERDGERKPRVVSDHDERRGESEPQDAPPSFDDEPPTF